MFAFAIWDDKQKLLHLARDRVGKKPLFYAKTKDYLAFASEIKGLYPLPDWSRELDFEAFHHYLTLQYVPDPHSIYRGVKKLPPAHFVTIEPASGQMESHPFWRLNYIPKISISLSDAIENTRELITEAVKKRLEADVPMGVFLSGGVDSSIVTAIASKLTGGGMKTFSIGFEEDGFNELPYARLIAEEFETEHTEYVVQPEAARVLPDLAWHLDEPLADPAILPTYYMSKLTRKQVVVALNGDGGDESFAGYSRYRGFYPNDFWRAIPRLAKYAATPLFPLIRWKKPDDRFWKLAQYTNRVHLMEPFENYAQSMVYFSNIDKFEAYTPEFRQRFSSLDTSANFTLKPMRQANASELIDRMMASDISSYLPGALLPKVDRMSMAVSLEARSPFLDYKLMEWAAKLPTSIKFPNREPKALLKRAFDNLLPAEILYRQKSGFSVPIAKWLRQDLREMARDLLLSREAQERGIIQPNWVEKRLNEHQEGTLDNKRVLWTLMMFELWARMAKEKATMKNPS